MLAKSGDTQEQGTEAVRPSEVQQKISAPALKKLLKLLEAKQEKIDELTGEIGGEIAKIVEKKNVNKKMLGWIRQLNRMTPEKLADNLDDFNDMLDKSGLNDRAASAQRLPMGGEESSAEEE